MIALLIALIVLGLAFRRLLSSSQLSKSQAQAKKASKKPTAREKIATEAFEFAPTDPEKPRPILVLYATEYGFAREVARKVAEALASLAVGDDASTPLTLVPRIVNVLHYPMLDFTRETFVAFVCSTTGDGVPPNEATAFRDALTSNDLVIPSSCRVSVLALGDRAYPHFCRAGAIFDSLFSKSRLLERVDVDQEDWPVINDWIDDLSAAIKRNLTSGATSPEDYLQSAIDKYAAAMEQNDARYTRNNPFLATIVSHRLLSAARTGATDDKEVIRVEFDTEGSGIRYEVGDALAVVPKNNPEHVTRLLLAMACNGDESVRLGEKGEPLEFEDALMEQLDIATVRPELVAGLAARSEQTSEKELAKRLLDGDGLSPFGKEYVGERDVFDVLSDFVSARMSAQDLTNLLRPLHARYYSISSTPVTTPGRIAATVDVLRYTSLNIERQGVASTFLQDRCRLHETKVPVFITKNPNFRLPKDGSKPIIMIGPGTGIAPFVAFVEERIACDAQGENWLFFGCRHEQQDFLYNEQLAEWVDSGCLTLHTAFSRDGPEKVYVQRRIRECAETLWRLIDVGGAHVYICGDGAHMAGDVDDALREIIQQCGGKSREEAGAYLESLSELKRYQRDVWVS